MIAASSGPLDIVIRWAAIIHILGPLSKFIQFMQQMHFLLVS